MYDSKPTTDLTLLSICSTTKVSLLDSCAIGLGMRLGTISSQNNSFERISGCELKVMLVLWSYVYLLT